MMDGLPAFVSIVFILTTLLTIGFLFSAVRSQRDPGIGGKLVIFLVPFWLLLTGFLAVQGFYQSLDSVPPRVFVFGVLPALILIIILLVFFRSGFVEKLPLKTLTLLHIVRIPVELVLFWLYDLGQVPREMTFEGWNFDILSGVTAPIIYWLAFRRGDVNRPLLIGWNLAALALLFNIVTVAFLSFRSPLQRIAFDQPNIGVTYFPFIWLPAVIVPIVLFSHLASLVRLLGSRNSPQAAPSETR